MRRKNVFFIAANAMILGFLIHLFWPLICLLFINEEDDRLMLDEINPPDGQERKPQVIPKIIHQTWIVCHVPDMLSGNCMTKPIPDKWKGASTSVKDTHDDYEYKLWMDQNSREFIEKEFPWFLPTWDSYPYPIQRADAIRYFVIYHFGGIYIDLDDGSQHNLDPLLVFRAWVRRSKPKGIGNDVIAAVPQHPFIEKTVNSLQSSNVRWPTPYITIMASTGPLFFSVIWRNYKAVRHAEEDRVRLLFPREYMGTDQSFFVHNEGNSWHQWDAELMFWMWRHWLAITITGFIVGGLVIIGLWHLSNWISGRRRGKSQWKHTPMSEADNMD